MRSALLVVCLIAACGCADQRADLRSQAQSQASFIQDLSDGCFGKDSPPAYSPAGSIYAPNMP
jgi:hypothetical protein